MKKMKTKNIKKSYPIKDSFLFRMRNVRKLERILYLAPYSLSKAVIAENLEYNCFEKNTGTKKRKIEAPINITKASHRRLCSLFQRIETPPYLFSGIRGLSYIDNALKHKLNSNVLTLDIKNFYPSCRQKHIFEMFKNKFEVENDVAGALTRLVTIDGHLPTGSPVSQILVYLTYKDSFDEIEQLCEDLNLTFSLYVDDMAFSSDQEIPNEFEKKISDILMKKGLEIKQSKSRYYKTRDHKKITGVAFNPEKKAVIPNKLRYKIITNFEAIKNGTVENLDKAIKSLKGQIQAARKIEPNAFCGILNYINDISKNEKKS